jgi:hypothetical protein
LNKGSIWRLGQQIKDQGERIGHLRLFGVHFLNWLAGPVIRLGLSIRDSIRDCPIGELEA